MKLAIFRALQLGDILCAIPAIRAIRRAFPNGHITFTGLPGTVEIIKRFPHYFDDFIAFPGYPGLPEQPFDQEKYDGFLQDVQHRQFDLIFQMQGNGSIVNTMLQSFKSGNLAGFCEHEAEANEWLLKYPDFGHEITRHLALVQHIGIQPDGTEMEFPLTLKDAREFDELSLPVSPREYVCIHPGSRGSWRQWPAIYFAALADYCADKGHKVVLTGTKEELDLVNRVAMLMKTKPIITAGKTSIGALGFLIQQSFALIANCTGVSHIAAALHIPSIIISMDGEPQRWGPLNKALHRTIDWTKTPDYNIVFKELEDLYSASNRDTAATTSSGSGGGSFSV